MDMLGAMETFVRIAEASSLSRAARSLDLSLPAVSRQLHALEVELGTKLVVRTTRRMALTEAGRLFYDSAVGVLRDVGRARERVRPSREVRGALVVSAPVSIALTWVVPRLPALVAKHPRLEIELRLEDQLVDFVREGVDVAIRGGIAPPDSNAYLAVPLSRFRRVLVAAPSYLKRRGLPRAPEDLASHACLLQVGQSGPMARWTLHANGAGGGVSEVTVTGPVRSTAPLALRELALGGAGIALLGEWLATEAIAAGRLRRLLPTWSSPEVVTWAVHRMERKGAPAIAALVDALRTS